MSELKMTADIAIDKVARLRSENERLTKDLEHANKLVQQYVGLWDEAERQLTALRRPVEQSAEVEAIRKYCIEWFEEAGAWVIFDTFQVLLSALDTTARQARERVEMLEAARLENNRLVVQDARSTGERIAMQQEIARLSSPPPERAEIVSFVRDYCEPYPPDSRVPLLIGYCKALLADLTALRNAHQDRVQMLSVVQDSLTERNRECVELRGRIERLEGALRSTVEAIRESIRTGKSLNNMDFDRVGGQALSALAASQQHTAGTGDGVANAQQPIVSAAGKQLLSACGLLSECAQFMDAAKECDSATWTDYDQSLRDRVSGFIREVLPPAEPMDDCKPSQRDLSTLCGSVDGVAGD